MITWMLYAIVCSVAVTVAAHAAEWGLRSLVAPRRLAWAGALALSALLPLATLAIPRRGDTPVGSAAPWAVSVQMPDAASPLPIDRGRIITAVVVALWVATSGLLLVALFRAHRQLHRARAGWRTTQVAGRDVYLAADAGPAVFGILRREIVLPAWLLEFDAPLLALVVAHEGEHADARDTALLAVALSLVALLPWNPALWWQLRRLRLAVEIDCDARVLGEAGDVRRYASLLLAVGQRTRSTSIALLALRDASTTLDPRIRAMSPRSRTRHGGRAAVAALVTLVAVAFACAAPNPGSPKDVDVAGASQFRSTLVPSGATIAVAEPANAASLPRKSADVANTAAQCPTLQALARQAQQSGTTATVYGEQDVDCPVMPASDSPTPSYPPRMKSAGTAGEVLARFVVDEHGSVVPGSVKIARASNDVFGAAITDYLPRARFLPGLKGGRAVKQQVTEPFTFAMSR